MDSKTFISRLARQTGNDVKTATDMLNALTTVLRDKATDLDSVAIPGFGNFVSMKRQERIVLDSTTGKRCLVPPKISVEFIAGSKLKKSISNE